MLHLRVARGHRPLDLLRRLLIALASAVVAALLLRALGRALSDPAGHHGDEAVRRLLWCLPALAALAYLTAAWARALPGHHPERIAGLLAAGVGTLRLRLLLAGEVALACALGAALALVGYLTLRNGLIGPDDPHRYDGVLAVHESLPPAAVATLLCAVPLVGAVAAALALRGADLRAAMRGAGAGAGARAGAGAGAGGVGVAAEDAGWREAGPLRPAACAALVCGGTATELTAVHARGQDAAAVGGTLAVVGIAFAVPLLLDACGRALTRGRPRASRLLAGRVLQAEAGGLGTPLAVLAVTGAVGGVAVFHASGGHGGVGALPRVEAALLALCVVGAVLTRHVELAGLRESARTPLRRLGAPGSVLRRAAALRGAAAASVVVASAAASAALAAGLLAA